MRPDCTVERGSENWAYAPEYENDVMQRRGSPSAAANGGGHDRATEGRCVGRLDVGLAWTLGASAVELGDGVAVADSACGRRSRRRTSQQRCSMSCVHSPSLSSPLLMTCAQFSGLPAN
jgi:hypothetical protein